MDKDGFGLAGSVEGGALFAAQIKVFDVASGTVVSREKRSALAGRAEQNWK